MANSEFINEMVMTDSLSADERQWDHSGEELNFQRTWRHYANSDNSRDIQERAAF